MTDGQRVIFCKRDLFKGWNIQCILDLERTLTVIVRLGRTGRRAFDGADLLDQSLGILKAPEVTN